MEPVVIVHECGCVSTFHEHHHTNDNSRCRERLAVHEFRQLLEKTLPLPGGDSLLLSSQPPTGSGPAVPPLRSQVSGLITQKEAA